MTRALWKILKGGLVGAGILLGVALVLAVSLWLFPGLLLNDGIVPRVVRWGAKDRVRWTKLHVHARSLSFFRKELVVSASHLCLEIPDEAKGCIAAVDLDAIVNLSNLKLALAVPRLAVVDADLSVTLPEGESPPRDAPDGTRRTLLPAPPTGLARVTFGDIDVSARSLELVSSGSRANGALRLTGRASGGAAEWRLEGRGTYATATDRWELGAHATLASLHSLWFGPYRASVVADADNAGVGAVHATVEASSKTEREVDFEVAGRYEGPKGRAVSARTRGSLSPERLRGVLDGRGARLTSEVRDVLAMGCKYDVAVTAGNRPEREIALDCPLRLSNRFPELKNAFFQDVLRTMNVTLKTRLFAEDLPFGRVRGDVSAAVDPFFEKSREGSLRVATRIEGKIADFPKDWKIAASAGFRSTHFQKIVQLVRKQAWAVPEPFASLDGTVEIGTDGDAKLEDSGGAIPVKLTTRLGSKSQALELDGKGTFSLARKGEAWKSGLDFALSLTNVRLVLPRFGLRAPPKLFPDKRIKATLEDHRRLAAEAQKAKGAALSYHVTVVTPPGKAVELVTDLTEAPLPVHVSLLATPSSALTGSLRVGETPAKLFNRNAVLKRLDLKLTPDEENTEVNGEIQVVYTDYTIRILVLGLLKQPEVKFLSDPPLPEDQVIAVLLFGKKMEALDRSQAESTGNFQSAVADSAVSLASMYLLASTPVESIGYDPVGRVFNAKIRLADGTSLNVGTDMRALNQLGIRKRLGRNWAITTYLEHPLDPVTRSLTAFLEWSRGY